MAGCGCASGSPGCGCASHGCGGQAGCRPGGYGRSFTAEEAIYDNCIWPKQYIAPSRRGICQSFDVMVNNGWRRHNLLSKYHFDPQSGELNEAGRLKTEWTLTQNPMNHRTLYVERNIVDQQQTAERVAAVQSFASSIGSVGAADVQETHVREHGHPAGGVDAVFTGFRANQMAPALPQASAGTAATP